MSLTLDEVSVIIGFSKPYLSTIETGKVKNPPSDNLLIKLERALQFDRGLLVHIAHMERIPPDVRRDYEVTGAENKRFRQIIRNLLENKTDTSQLSQLLAEDDITLDLPGQMITAGDLVPIINKASAGFPVDFDDLGYPVGYADDYVRCPDLHDPNAFAVRVVGDSMEPKYVDGDIVVFSPASNVKSGDDCFVRFTQPHESTFKRIFFEEGDQVRLQPLNQKYPPTILDGKRINGIYRAVIRYERL